MQAINQAEFRHGCISRVHQKHQKHTHAPIPRVPFLTDNDRTWGITPLQKMLQRQEWGGGGGATNRFGGCRNEHEAPGWFLTFMSCWSRPRSVKQKAVPGSPDSCGGRGQSKFASEHTFTENKHNNQDTSLTENVTTGRNHWAESAAL